MKVLRLTDTNYVVQFGPEVTHESLNRFQEAWKDWWSEGADPSKPLMVGGVAHPLEFEDARGVPDLESRLDDIEKKLSWLIESLS